MTTAGFALTGITCSVCRQRGEQMLLHGQSLMSGGKALYEGVGNVVLGSMGHLMYFTDRGRIAICTAP